MKIRIIAVAILMCVGCGFYNPNPGIEGTCIDKLEYLVKHKRLKYWVLLEVGGLHHVEFDYKMGMGRMHEDIDGWGASMCAAISSCYKKVIKFDKCMMDAAACREVE